MSSSRRGTGPKMPENADEHRNRQLAAQAGLKWGKTPACSSMDQPLSKLPDGHPVHKIPLEQQEKMRQKGINPVLRAEMDEALGKGHPEGKFWKKHGTTSMGPWMYTAMIINQLTFSTSFITYTILISAILFSSRSLPTRSAGNLPWQLQTLYSP